MRQHQFNFVRRLSWSISSIFQRKFTLSVSRSLKSQKITETPHFWRSRSFKVIDVGTPGKLVSSACYR